MLRSAQTGASVCTWACHLDSVASTGRQCLIGDVLAMPVSLKGWICHNLQHSYYFSASTLQTDAAMGTVGTTSWSVEGYEQQLSPEKWHQELYKCPEGPCPVIKPSNMLTNLLQKISAVSVTRAAGRAWALTQFAHRKAMGPLALTGASSWVGGSD